MAACGTEDIELSKSDPNYEGAELFVEHCSGCHTLDVAGTEGSAVKVGSRERKDGPNFNQRKEDAADVLYAIENGGFSSGPMPQNIVTGEDAQKIADFIAKYSGKDAPKTDQPQRRVVLDLRAIRRDPEPVRDALARRRDGSDARLDDVLALDARRLELLPEVEALRARQNEASQEIARAKKAGERRRGGDRRDAGGLPPGEGAGRGADRRRVGARDRARRRCPTRPTRRRPTRTRRCARSARRAPRGATTWSWPGR